MRQTKSLAAVALALMFLGACSSTGGLGDILGGANQSNYEIRGTVDSVDISSRSIWLTNVSGYDGSRLSSGGVNNNAVRVYYDDQTSVTWEGQSYRPQDLERGDRVVIRVDESGNNTLIAEAVNVTYNSSQGMTSGSNYPGTSDDQYATVRGTVRSVDVSRGLIELESTQWRSGFNTGATGGNRIVISFNNNIGVDVNGQMYPVSGLESGDVVEVQVQRSNNNNANYWAERIFLVRDVRSNF